MGGDGGGSYCGVCLFVDLFYLCAAFIYVNVLCDAGELLVNRNAVSVDVGRFVTNGRGIRCVTGGRSVRSGIKPTCSSGPP